MKVILIVYSFLFFAVSSKSQIIDNKNYYDYSSSSGSINWLRPSDAVPVIIDQLLKKNIAYHTISIGDLIEINDSAKIVSTVSFELNGKRYGFIFETSHSIPLNPKHRDFLKNDTQITFQTEFDIDGNFKSSKEINPLPKNIFLLKEDCYWYQYGDNKNNPVSKDVIQQILRQDIDEYLKRI